MSKEQTTKVTLAEFKKIYSRIFNYALKYKWTLSLSIFSLVVLALTNTGFLALIKKITEIIVNVVEKNPDKALEILNKNENTNTVTEVIKNKIEKGEAITGEDFEEVFKKNVSPN